MANILEISNLEVIVPELGEKVLVDKVSFEVPQQGIVSLVGGSGSGKTTIGLSILGLLHPALRVKNGIIRFKSENLLDFREDAMQKVRGNEISMVFQEPLNAFNPVFSIGDQIDEVLSIHTSMTTEQRKTRILELLDIVGMDDPKRVAHTYPHQLSGGMRQRAMIAQSIAANPSLIIADEPTSSLDVTLQARVIELFKKLRNELGVSVLLITHDLGMVEHMADDVVVLSKGQVVELGKTNDIVQNPKHPYTEELMNVFRI